MSKVLIEESTLTSIANAIREKTATSSAIPVTNMNTMILNIEAGGGGESLPDEAFHITSSMAYKFMNGGWDWFIREYGNRITTEDIIEATHAFTGSGIDEIPFSLNFSTDAEWHGCASMLAGAGNLKVVPQINNFKPLQAVQLFNGCSHLREMPYVDIDFSYMDNYGDPWSPQWSQLFGQCYSLRSIDPMWLRQPRMCTATGNLFYFGFSRCSTLDELVDLPFPETLRIDYSGEMADSCYWNENGFYESFPYCSRLKKLTFKQYPVGLKMANQVLDLSYCVGWTPDWEAYSILDYNSGITYDTHVINTAAYESLKDTKDWWTTSQGYSRYNLTSAIETLNSLPDTSEWASQNGINTIIFDPTCGGETDGGSIGDLPVELINEVADKGWTVTFQVWGG
jgi:hypothetical protein